MYYVDSIYNNERKLDFQASGIAINFINGINGELILRNDKDFGLHYDLNRVTFKVFDGKYQTIKGVDFISFIKTHDIYGSYTYISKPHDQYYGFHCVPEYFRYIIDNSKVDMQKYIGFVMLNFMSGDYYFENDNLVMYAVNVGSTKEKFGVTYTGIRKEDEQHLVKIMIPLSCSQKELAGLLTKYRLMHNGVI